MRNPQGLPALHVESLGGSDDEAVMFLHGLTGSTRSWGDAIRALSARRRLLLVDALGFGRSPKPKLEYSLDEHLQAIQDAVQREGVLRTHLVGYSTGALMTLAYAARQPQEVASLTLIATPWYGSEEEARQGIGRRSFFMRWMAMDNALAHTACTLMCLSRPLLEKVMPLIVRDVPARVARDVIQHNWISYSRSLRHLVLEARPDVWLRRVRAPVLFIHGSKDRTAPLANLKAGIAGHAFARLEVMDATHYILFERELEIAERLSAMV